MYWYYNTFTKPDDPQTCLAYTQSAFASFNLIVRLTEGYTTVASAADNSVFVQVTCVPQAQDTWVVVTTFSDDNNVAETTQNNVRTDIQTTVRID
ncbi:hypothetical protein GCM10009641_26990 [Mycobacterium cookii]|uniref:Uncharacterized protein n=1 Tax=Mycobacterium cookii TaxID=1775 RepID=A0A7I7KRF6_9MYCO|nr:hypothetical protein [Mycobacterium cookii]MCV7331331.1 hypothetical protein [Mycobacterium cookii]BBX44710.1 hypothetical protein MCOO_07250 [Mycobacterium cookii]